jgi:hypothetical protein
LPLGSKARDLILRRAQQAERALQVSEWLRSPKRSNVPTGHDNEQAGRRHTASILDDFAASKQSYDQLVARA